MNQRHLFRHLAAILGLLGTSVSFAGDGTVNFSGVFSQTTCSVTTQNVSASFGKSVNMSAFGAAGTTSDWGPDFTISLDCAGSSSNVRMVFSDTTTPANRSSTLTLTPASSATGIGIQFWQSRSALNSRQYSFGPDSSASNTTNQFQVYQANGNATQKVDLVFSWRYVRTTAPIKPGSANGKATFTMSYQ